MKHVQEVAPKGTVLIMRCALCERLEAEFDGAERACVKARKDIDQHIETATRAEFAKLRLAESDACLDLEMLRILLERHRLEYKEHV